MRVLIIGGSGVGKTTLAGALGALSGISATDGDPIAYVDDRWTLRPLEARLRMAQELASRDHWVVSTGQLVGTEQLAERAELIVWLDIPLLRQLWRITKRYVRDHPLGHGFSLRQLVGNRWLWNSRWYFRRLRPGTNLDRELSRSATDIVYRPYSAKVVRLRRNPTAHEVLDLLG